MTLIGKYAKRYSVLLSGIASAIALVSCQRVSPAEEKIIGTWEFTGLDVTGRCVFRRDHIVITLFPQGDGPKEMWAPTAWGTWRLEGSEIVTDEEVLPIPGVLSSQRQVARIPIRAFEEDRLVRADDRADFYRVRWGVERYSQVLALLYLTGSLIVFSASVYGIRKSSLRKEFILLGLATFVALLWSVSTLLPELAQTGAVILSATSLHSMRVPTEILRVVCIVIFMIGFAKLTHALRRRPTCSPQPLKPSTPHPTATGSSSPGGNEKARK